MDGDLLARNTALSSFATAKVSLDGDNEMQHSCSQECEISNCSLSVSYTRRDKHWFLLFIIKPINHVLYGFHQHKKQNKNKMPLYVSVHYKKPLLIPKICQCIFQPRHTCDCKYSNVRITAFFVTVIQAVTVVSKNITR